MRLSQIKILAALKKYGTMLKASKQLYISQPALSKSIKELEQELGVIIIERSNKGIVFTEQGEEILRYSQEILTLLEKIEQVGAKSMQLDSLAIASVYYIFDTVVMDAFFTLKNKYAEMFMSIQEENSYEIVELLAENKIDIGVVMITKNEKTYFEEYFQEKDINFYPLFSDSLRFIMSVDHPLANRERLEMKDLMQYAFLNRKGALNQRNKEMLAHYNAGLEIIQIDNEKSLLKYLMTSDAISATPTCSFWREEIGANKGIVAREAEGFSWNSTVGYIVRKETEDSHQVQKFAEMLKNACHTWCQRI